MLSNRLCNPTGDDIEFQWHCGIMITIPSDATVEVTKEQMDDFIPNTPGAEEVQLSLQYKGLFLLDGDRDYDVQALESLKAAYAAKNNQFRESVSSLRRSRSAAGITDDDESFKENLRQLGLDALEKRVEDLQERVSYFDTVCRSKAADRSRSGQLDPLKTLYLHEGPPREFPSEAAKAFFKQKNPDLVSGDPADGLDEDGS